MCYNQGNGTGESECECFMEREAYQNIAKEISGIPVPMYYRLKMDIISKINTGEWSDHEKLPSENELCNQYGISRITVRKAFDELVASKYIYKIQGKGTYVSPKAQREIVLTRQTYGCEEMLRLQGHVPSHRVHTIQLVPCSEEVALSLELQQGDPVLEYIRTYYGDGRPMIFVRSYIDQRRLPGIEKANFAERRLSDILMQDFGLTTTSQRCALTAVVAGDEIGAALGVDPGFPLLRRCSLVSVTNGVNTMRVELSHAYYRTDSAPFVTEG